MTLAEVAGGGPLFEALAGIIGPEATKGLLTIPRKALAKWLKDISTNNPKIYVEIHRIAEQYPEHAFSKFVRQVKDKIAEAKNSLHSNDENYNVKSDPNPPAIKNADNAPHDAKAGDKTDEVLDYVKSAGELWESAEYSGRKVYQRKDLIDLKRVDPKGRTRQERMKIGHAAIGPDGKRVHLHHALQSNEDALFEVTQTLHQQKTKTIHINPNTIPSVIDGGAARAFREKYWRERLKDFQ